MFLAWRFSPVVNAYKNIQAYHAGDGVWVEVDLLLDPKVDLRHAHDLAELMQYCELWPRPLRIVMFLMLNVGPVALRRL